ncbi:zinc finger MYND domain-containing protein [Rhodotorula paludigena]|uniref:zinc finger MYND domain-containing protein n=1 Tax=Rhodotorula paludigena TaxID=86838 RepID=UPI003180BFE0
MEQLVQGLCLVCSKATKQKCSKCGEPFCSTECQKALWPTHKWLCDKPKYIFTLAPLSQLELKQAKAVVSSTENKMIEAMKDVDIAESDGWREGNYENFINDLADPACEISEPSRSTMIYEMHQLVRVGWLAKVVPDDSEKPISPWNDLCVTWGLFKHPVPEEGQAPADATGWDSLGPSHFTLYNAFHRRMLVFWTLKHLQRQGKALPPTVELHQLNQLSEVRTMAACQAAANRKLAAQVVLTSAMMGFIDDITGGRNPDVATKLGLNPDGSLKKDDEDGAKEKNGADANDSTA